MGRGRRGSFLLSSILIVAGLVVGAGRGVADELAMRPAREMAFLAGPSLRETGRVGAIPLAYAGARIEQIADRRLLKDVVVHPRTSDGGDRPRAGFLSASILAHELEEPVAALQDCRIEVARRQQRTWNAVAAGRVTLRWTILPTGTVAHVEVAAIDPLDLHVLDCMKREMALWTFARPRGGIVAVAQPFAFR